jgi:hypothetical protein
LWLASRSIRQAVEIFDQALCLAAAEWGNRERSNQGYVSTQQYCGLGLLALLMLLLALSAQQSKRSQCVDLTI